MLHLLPLLATAAGGAVGEQAVRAVKDYVKDTLEEVGSHTAEQLLVKGVIGATLPMMISGQRIKKLAKESHGKVQAYKLQKLLKTAAPHKAIPITVQGVFMPGKLLTMGWWEDGRRVDNNTAWQVDKGIQSWLFSGFEQWAPSWSLTDWESDADPDFLVGQIGTHDEADSIMVVVRGREKARKLRDDIKQNWNDRQIMVANATVVAALCPGHMLAGYVPAEKKSLVDRLARMKLVPKHFLLVDETDPFRVTLDPASDIDHYSGYLWKCMCPADIAKQPDSNISVMSSFFIWEHTNFANRDALNYNLDSLHNKVDYLTKRVNSLRNKTGKLALLQEMMPEAQLRSGGRGKTKKEDKPLLQTQEFVQLIGALSRSGRG
jgi:hypothetical protein